MTDRELSEKIKRLLPESEEIDGIGENRRISGERRYTPNYHFSSPGGYLNDPCGLCFWKDAWHLFYQFVPEGEQSIVWGHAVSVDMIRWHDLPPAITPTFEDVCGSGGTLVEERRVIACYQGSVKGRSGCAIHIAVSEDELLLHWKKLTEYPSITTLDEHGMRNPYNAFDPFMWRDNGRYYLISAGGGSLPHPVTTVDCRRFYLFESDDLISWRYLHEFLQNDLFAKLGDDGACPYFLPFGDKHMLLHFSHMSGGQYIIGDYDREGMTFSATQGRKLNSNSWICGGVHAPSAFPDGKGGIAAIFNINYGCLNRPENQIMSLPRRYIPVSEGRPLVEPMEEYESLREDFCADNLNIPANTEVLLEGVDGDSLEIELTVDTLNKCEGNIFIADNLMPVFELRVLRSGDCREYTSVLFYRNRGEMNWSHFDAGRWGNSSDSVLMVDAAHSTLSADVAIHPPESVCFYLDPNEPVKLHIFVDKSVVEVFSGDTECISMRSYPSLEDSTGVSVISRGVPAVVEYKTWKLKKIAER